MQAGCRQVAECRQDATLRAARHFHGRRQLYLLGIVECVQVAVHSCPPASIVREVAPPRKESPRPGVLTQAPPACRCGLSVTVGRCDATSSWDWREHPPTLLWTYLRASGPSS